MRRIHFAGREIPLLGNDYVGRNPLELLAVVMSFLILRRTAEHAPDLGLHVVGDLIAVEVIRALHEVRLPQKLNRVNHRTCRIRKDGIRDR